MSIGQTSPDKSMGVSGVFSSVLQPFDCNLNEPGEFMRILISTRLLIADFALRIAASPAKVCLRVGFWTRQSRGRFFSLEAGVF